MGYLEFVKCKSKNKQNKTGISFTSFCNNTFTSYFRLIICNTFARPSGRQGKKKKKRTVGTGDSNSEHKDILIL